MKAKWHTIKTVVLGAALFFVPAISFAAHPVGTDDAGTVGQRKFQFELSDQYDHNKDNGETTKVNQAAVNMTYGATDTLDLVVGIPYVSWSWENQAGAKTWGYGNSDMTVDLKWRFYEHEGLGLALKPGVTLPTGEYDNGLGKGKATYHLVFVTTKEVKPMAFHLNLGYTLNDSKDDVRKSLWRVSAAADAEVMKGLKLAVETAMERGEDKASDTNPAYVLGGLIYSLSENLDIDFGYKKGLNKAVADYSVLAGVTLKY